VAAFDRAGMTDQEAAALFKIGEADRSPVEAPEAGDRGSRAAAGRAEVFETFLERVLIRKLKPGDIAVLDNVRADGTADVRRLIRVAGGRVRYLPPRPEQAEGAAPRVRRSDARRPR